MGFFTSFCFCRCGRPPKITCGDLAKVVHEFDALAVSPGSFRECDVIFGESIDHDDDPMDEVVQLSDVMSKYVPRPRDIEVQRPKSLAEIVAALDSHAETSVYRAHIALGGVTQEFLNRIHEPSEQNKRAWFPQDWSLQISPVILGGMNTTDQFHFSYAAVCLSGAGYAFPRTPRQIVERLRDQPEVQRVEQLCERSWPVGTVRADDEVIEMRKAMGYLWPYERLDLPHGGWIWSTNETG
jgi:hypothetical protein